MTPQERAERGPVIGRPALPPEEKLHVYSIRLTEAQYAKLLSVGGRAAVRDWIDSLKAPRRKGRAKQ